MLAPILDSTVWDVCMTLPVPPTVNQWARKRRKAWTKDIKQINRDINKFEWALKAEVLNQDIDLIRTSIHVHIELHHSRIDLDNVRKVLYDALTHCNVIKDDSIIVSDSGRKHRSPRKQQRVEVMIKMLNT